ncbi:replication initiation protein [Agrobacterium rubi]|nr:replication initiation protein [Agrobacterium rubi]NTF24196.1 replication initiation protein [Agrobacterium rubi]
MKFGLEQEVFREGSSIITAVPHQNFPFTSTDEHIFTYFLCRFYHEISPGSRHVVPVRDVLEFARMDRPSKLHDSLRRLGQGFIEIDYVDQASQEKRTIFAHYLSSDVSHSERGMLEFAFDPILVPFLKDPKIYGMISALVIHNLKSVAAQQLYKMMCLHYRLRNPVWQVTVDSLRSHFRVGDKHARFDNFRQNVIEKAIAEVNAVALEFDVMLDNTILGGKGGQVQEVVFRAVPKSHTRILEAAGVREQGRVVAKSKRKRDAHTVDLLDGMTNAERGRPAEVSSIGMEKARDVMAPDADLNQLLEEWRSLNVGRVFSDPDKAFIEWIEMSVERANDPVLRNIDADVFGTLLAQGD